MTNILKTSVVIPFLNNWSLTHARLYELYQHVPKETEVILVDDASTDADIDPGVEWWQSGPLVNRLRYFKNLENLGFGGSMNKGVKIAIKNGAQAVVLLSNDVTVMSNFVESVATILSLDPRVLLGGEYLCNDTGWNVLPGMGVVPYVNGWFLATHVDTWKELGGFDPAFQKFDYEDVDLSTMAWYLGIKLAPVSAKLRHAHGQTVRKFYPDREKYTRINQKVWIAKWSDPEKLNTLRKNIYGY